MMPKIQSPLASQLSYALLFCTGYCFTISELFFSADLMILDFILFCMPIIASCWVTLLLGVSFVVCL
ncbi:hypothetical protein SETIT_1G133600v2 [Setaria italica]|uniref:Uncharacterized protein n=1 Tax=Setaria italica TaxID=4555 RepID=A0A368PKQ7_SETIT|nr:hypothetical protein SETIT_1G133600v2 [Setaria italica]